MKSTKTVIRFKMESEKSAQGPIYKLTAEVEEDSNREWNCHLNIKETQSRMELSIEASPSKLNKNSTVVRVPLFFYDIYQSRLQPAKRNETAERLRVDLMIVSRTSLPYATFHSLGRTNIAQEAVAGWLTNTISEHLQKTLKMGFDAIPDEKPFARAKAKITSTAEPASAEDDGAEEQEWLQDALVPVAVT